MPLHATSPLGQQWKPLPSMLSCTQSWPCLQHLPSHATPKVFAACDRAVSQGLVTSVTQYISRSAAVYLQA